MGFFKKLFTWGKSEANALVDRITDDMKVLDLKIVEQKEMLDKSVNGLAKVKAIEIKQRSKAEQLREQADSYLEKANQLKVGMKNGTFKEEDAKKDILLLLNRHENVKNEATAMDAQADKQDKVVKALEKKIKDLKTLITTTEAKVVNLKAEREAAKANKEISKELSTLNVDSAASQIAELENKIQADNAEADAWEHLSESTMTDEERIDKMLNEASPTSDDELLKNFLEDDTTAK